MENTIFSTRLKMLMKEKNIKQIELVHMAEEKGIKLGKSHISQYVSGKTVPRKEILAFLADALDSAPEWLIGKDESAQEKLSDLESSNLASEKMRGIDVKSSITDMANKNILNS